jgi:hypothetical protein
VLRKVIPFVLAVVIVGSAGPLRAQTTGTPVFLAPYRAFDRIEFGASLSDPGQGFALEGFYRWGAKKYDFGFRGGFADADPGRTRFLVGVDFRTRVVDHSEDFPLDGAFTMGLGADFGDGITNVRIPVGISLGRRVQLEDSDIQFVPYLHPVLGPVFGDSDTNLAFAVGLGVDVTFNRRFELRVSAALGDYEGVGISFAFLR